MENKITYAQALETAIQYVGADENQTAVRDRLVELLESLNKRNKKSGPTKAQKANETIKNRIVEVLTDSAEPLDITALFKATDWGEGVTPQKITALVTQLVKEENPRVAKIVDKKKTYYEVVS